MTDAEYEEQKARIVKLSEQWITWLGLKWWHIEIRYEREGLQPDNPDDAKAGYRCVFKVTAKWHYLDALIRVNCLVLPDLSDEELERSFVHELCHILINEMRQADQDDWLEHEERVVTTLASAFIWTAQFATQEGK